MHRRLSELMWISCQVIDHPRTSMEFVTLSNNLNHLRPSRISQIENYQHCLVVSNISWAYWRYCIAYLYGVRKFKTNWGKTDIVTFCAYFGWLLLARLFRDRNSMTKYWPKSCTWLSEDLSYRNVTCSNFITSYSLASETNNSPDLLDVKKRCFHPNS